MSYFINNHNNFTWFRENILKQPKKYTELILNTKSTKTYLWKCQVSRQCYNYRNLIVAPYKFLLEGLVYLKDRTEYDVNSLNIGDCAHKALENIFNKKIF